MCHDLYHVDPDLRAVANAICGLHLAHTAQQRERGVRAAKLLISKCLLAGLDHYIRDEVVSLADDEVVRFLVRLKAIDARLSQEALEMLRDNPPLDEVPF